MNNQVSKDYEKKNSEAFLVQEIFAAYREFRNKEGIKLAKKFVKKNKKYQLVWQILGELYKRVNNIPEAILSYRKAIYLGPKDADAHNNLGLLLKSNNQKIEAEKSYRQAIRLDPKNSIAMNNLSNLLRQSGQIDEAETICRDALEIKPQYNMASMNLAIILEYQDKISECISILEDLIKSEDKLICLQAMTHLAIINYLRSQFDESRELLERSKDIQRTNISSLNNEKSYHTYLSKILNDEGFINPTSCQKPIKKLFVIGDSHSLTSHGLNINILGISFHCETFLIKGCKQWDLAKNTSNQFKNKFNKVFKMIPEKSNVLLSVGEIDCRLESGIIKYKEKYPSISIDTIIENTISGYFKYILELNKNFNHNLIFQTVPCPNLETDVIANGNYQLLNRVIKSLNNLLKLKTIQSCHQYLDLHSLTNRGDGFSNNKYHIDNFHLSRQAMIDAWETKFVA